MNTDSYFEIGTTHQVCQDYALSGTYKNLHYAIISDGCSSAENSEIGSQILCHVSRYVLQSFHDLFFEVKINTLAPLLGNSIIKRADEIRKLYPISINSLQATLLMIVSVHDNLTYLFGWGDGYILHKKRDKDCIEYIKIEYPQTNAPFYLITSRDDYIKKLGPDNTVRRTEGELGKDEPFITDNPFDHPFCTVVNPGPGDIIAVTTDGLDHYLNHNKDPVFDQQMMLEVMDFPNTQGVFVKRTMGFLKKSLLGKNWSHSDDIGIAAISI